MTCILGRGSESSSSEFMCLDVAQFTIRLNASFPTPPLCPQPVHFSPNKWEMATESLSRKVQGAETAKTDEQIVKQCLEEFSNSKTSPSASYNSSPCSNIELAKKFIHSFRFFCTIFWGNQNEFLANLKLMIAQVSDPHQGLWVWHCHQLLWSGDTGIFQASWYFSKIPLNQACLPERGGPGWQLKDQSWS